MTSKSNSQVPGEAEVDAGASGQSLRNRIRVAIDNQPTHTVTVLSSLLAAQDELGWLPPEAIDEIASRTEESVNMVWGVASFYPNFRFTRPGRHQLEVCWGPSCHILGAQVVLRAVLKKLGLENEGDTTDGAFSLKLNTCLGICAHAPALNVDGGLVGRASDETATLLIDKLRDQLNSSPISTTETGI